MDAFEQLVSEILWMEGYWTHTSVKVELTKEDKKAINLPSSPRWELDVVAYRGSENLLRVVECKSYLDSQGVRLCGFDGSDEKMGKRYKLFNNDVLREVVLRRLAQQFTANGACREAPTVKLTLACGHIASDGDRAGLRKCFDQKGWELWDEKWLTNRLETMARRGYENQISAVVAKLIYRGAVA